MLLRTAAINNVLTCQDSRRVLDLLAAHDVGWSCSISPCPTCRARSDWRASGPASGDPGDHHHRLKNADDAYAA